MYTGINGKWISLQEINCAGCDITKLESMNELVQLRVYMLRNNITRDTANGARLRDKLDLEMLQLWWKDYLSDSEEESSSMNDSNNSLSCEHFADTESDVLEGLEPHHSLNHLQISGYNGAKSPSWLGASFSYLWTLHLADCGEWEELEFLGVLPFLNKLKLRNMQRVKDVSIPSLQELVLIHMPNLERCSCNSVKDLNSNIRVLRIKRCSKMKVFSLFGRCGIEQNSWLSHLKELTIHDCPDLMIWYPLPPLSRTCKLSIASKLLNMNGSSDGVLIIQMPFRNKNSPCYEHSDELKIPDIKNLALHNLRFLHWLTIEIFDCPTSFSLDGFRQLINLKRLDIKHCKKLLWSNVTEDDTYDGMTRENINALPSLETINIRFSRIGVWLSVLLRNVQALQELNLYMCNDITGLFIEENEQSELSSLKSDSKASSSGDPDDAVTGSSQDRLLCIPSKLISSLKKTSFDSCYVVTCQGDKEVLSKLTSLAELSIERCPGLVSSCVVHKDRTDEHANGRWLLPQSLVKLEIDGSLDSEESLQLCFPGHLSGLKTLNIGTSPCLESLQLHYCTALEELVIRACESLTALEGLPSLGGLRSLEALETAHFILERVLSEEGYDIRPRLETLKINDLSVLTTSFCEHLVSLKSLTLNTSVWDGVTRLTDEQETALELLTSLKELRFYCCPCLEDLPAVLHRLSTLERLGIEGCMRLSRLPELGLPPSLEELEISWCRKELTDQCRTLATSKLQVKINGEYVKTNFWAAC